MCFAKVSEVKEGDSLIADNGFTCIHGEAVVQVFKDRDGLFVVCDEGKHYLDGQIKEDYYLGFVKGS